MSETVCSYQRKIISASEYESLNNLDTIELVDTLAKKYLLW